MKRVLVTGGFGYLGGRIVQALANDPGLEVTALSRQPRRASADVRAAVVDWNDPACLDRLCQGQDVLIHTAAMTEPAGEAAPEQALEFNGLATLRLVRAAENVGVERFVYLSTAKVYGQNPIGRITEATLPEPRSHYAITHRLAEDYVLASRLAGVVLRLANGIGAPVSADANCWSLIGAGMCRQAANERRIVLRSSGLQWRNFVAISDIVQAVTLGLSALPRGIYNVGGASVLTLFDLAQAIASRCDALLGYKPAIERVPPADGEVHSSLDFRYDEIAGFGYRPAEASVEREIDAILLFCREER